MKDLRAKPLALAIMALAASASLSAQENSSEPEVDEAEVVEPQQGGMEEVYVIGVRAAELKSRELEREVRGFSHIISQDDAGNFADQNVAESLQRVPGLTTIKNEGEGRFITIRGMGPGFVNVNLNGNELATAGEDSRAFALDAIPSDMLGSIEVQKALTPDQDLNSIAGVVNLKTISAFDRKGDSMKLKLQDNKQSYDDDHSPKVSLAGSNKLADDTVGIGYTLSWEKRNSVTYISEHHADNNPREINVDGVAGLVPFRYEAKQEDAERTRVAGSVTLEYKPNDDNHYTFNLSRTEFEDIDIAIREYHRWGQASLDEIVYLDTSQRLFGLYGTDLQHQFFIQEGDSITTAFSFSGEHTLDGGWELDYNLASSEASWDKPGGRRTQFRIRELPMLGIWGPNYFNSLIVDPDVLVSLSGNTDVEGGAYLGGYIEGERLQPRMEYDNLFIEDSFRDDEINQAKLNIRKSFDEGSISYIQFGGATKVRERTRDKDRWSIIPSDYSGFCSESIDPALCTQWTSGSGVQLGEFSTFSPAHPDIQYDFETYEEAERIIAVTAPLAYNSDQTQVNIDSTQDDHWLEENSSSVYAMLEWIPFADASVIAGVKYEKTVFESQGNFSIRNDREDNPELGTQADIVVALPRAENEYSDILPSVHFRWEPGNDLLYRAAVWTSFTRPGFDQARVFGSIASRIEFCIIDDSDYSDPNNSALPDDGCGEAREFTHPLDGTLAYDNMLDGNFYVSPSLAFSIGNPTLRAMTSVNYDTSISWYPSEDLYLQAAFFYKDIDDFIANVRSADLSFDEFPFQVPVNEIASVMPIQQGTVYENILYTVNGEWAKVYGVELSIAKNFENGFFVSGNATLQDSKAKLHPSLREAELPLPSQANEIGNLTVGWENDKYSVRLSTNYRSKTLEQIGDGWSDIYADNSFSLDFKASWEVNDWLNLYFDALNLTEDTGLEYFSGNNLSGGKILYQSEDYGTSVQLGANIKLM